MRTTPMKLKQILMMLTAMMALMGAMNCGATSITLTNSGSWNTAANWSPNQVPSTADTAIIGTGKSITGLGGTSPTVTTLTIQGTGSVTIDANTLTVSGVTTIGSSGAANLTISSGAIFTSTSTASGAYVFGGTSSSITNNGTFTCSGGNGSGGTTPIFQNNGTAAFTGSQQEFNSAVTVIQGANAALNLTSSSGTPWGGSSTLMAAASGNTVTYGSASPNVKATTYYNLTFSGSGTDTGSFSWTIESGGTLTVGGTVSLNNFSGLTFNGNLIVNTTGGSVTGNASIAVGGNVTVSSGTLYAQNGINVTGTTTVNGGILQLGNQSSGSGTFTGDFSLSSGTFNSSFGGQNDAVTFGGNLTVSGGTFTAGTGMHTFSGTGKTITGTISIPNVAVTGTITNAGTLSVTTALTGAGTLTQNANSTLNIGGTSTVTTLAATANTPNTVAYTSGGSQTVKAITYNNLTFSGAGTKTLGGAVTVNNTLTISAGTLADGGFTLTANGNVSNGGTHSGTGQISLSGGSASHSLNGTGAYGSLTLNDTNGASIASGTSTINGTLTLTSGVLSSGGGALTFGNSAGISRAAGSLSLTPTFGTSVNVTYNDVNPTTTGSELPTNTTVLNNLTNNNAAGVTLNAGATLKGTLALTSGQLITGANTLTVTSTVPIVGGSSSSYVYGTLGCRFATGSKSFTFPVGDSSTYAPVSLGSATVTAAGNLVVSTVNNQNSQGAFSSSGLSQSKYVNRDWTITAANGYVESAGNITLNFANDTPVGGMSTTTDVVGKYSGSTWIHPAVASRTSTSITVSGINSFSDWVIGELPVPTFSGLSSKTIFYGTPSVSLSGTLSANSGTAYPTNGSTVTASINGHAVNGTVIDGTGDFTINYNDSTLATDGVGSSPYVITYSFAGDANLAPDVNDTSTTLTITPTTPSVTVANSPVIYNGLAQAAAVNGSVAGTVSNVLYGGSAIVPTDAGTYPITADFVPADTADYNNLAGASAGNFVIQMATPNVTVNVGSYTYNGAAQGPNSVITSPASTGSVAYSYAGTGSTTYPESSIPPTAAGTYTVTATVAADANNNSASSSPTAFSINLANTSVGVTSSENPSGYGDSLMFTAALPADTANTATVNFLTNGVLFDTETLNGGNATSLSITNLPRGTNVITVEYAGDGNYLGSTNELSGGQVVTNHPPVAGDATYYRATGNSLEIAISDLLTNVTDVDGDTITLICVGSGTNGATIMTNATSIDYLPGTGASSNCNDSFTYTVSDGYGGSATGNVAVDVYSVAAPQMAIPTNDVVNIKFFGIPTQSYVVETTTNLNTTWWPLGTNTAGSDGSWQFTDPNATNTQQFYRSVQP